MGSLEAGPRGTAPEPPGGGPVPRTLRDAAGPRASPHETAPDGTAPDAGTDPAWAVAEARSLDDLLRVVTETARAVVGARQGVTCRLGADGTPLRSYVARGPEPAGGDPGAADDRAGGDQSAHCVPDARVLRRVTRENRPLRLSRADLGTQPEWQAPDTGAGRLLQPDCLAVPFAARDGTPLGAVLVADKADGTDFTAEDETALLHLAPVAAAAVEHVEAADRYERTVSHLGLALDAGRMGTWDWDYATGRVTWSTTLERIYGYEPGTFPGTLEAYAAHIHPDDAGPALARVEEARRTATRFDYAYRVRTCGGETRWLEGAGLPVTGADGRVVGMTGVCLDATERHEVEEGLRQEHRVIESLHDVGKAVTARLELSEVLQVVTDAATRLSGAAFGSFFYNRVNEDGESYLLYTLSGAPREAFGGFPMPRATEVFGPTFRGESTVRLADVTADPRYGRNAPYHGMPDGHLPVRSYLAVPVVLADGEVVGGLFFGHPEVGIFDEEAERLVTGVAGYAAIAIENARLYEAAQRELAARQEALEERAAVAARLEETVADLRAAETRYRDLVNSLEAVVWTATAPDLRFTFVSDRAETLLGYPGSRFVEQPGFWESIIHPDDREWAVSFCVNETAVGRDHDFEYRVVTADGRVLWLLDVVTVVRDEAGAVVGLQGLMVDVTRRKRAERREAAQLAVTRVLAESRVSGTAFDEIVRGLGASLEVDVAALWVVEGESLACTHVWTPDETRTGEFVEATRRLRLGPGEGMAGGVWQTADPMWLEDLRAARDFVRAQAAGAASLTSGFAVPILVGRQFFGVIECFWTEHRARDDELLETMGTIVTQLGQSLGRLRAEASLEETMQSLRRRSAQLRRLAEVASEVNTLDSISDVLHTVTHEARLLLGAHQATAHVCRPGEPEPPETSVSVSEKYADWRAHPTRPDDWVHGRVRESGHALRLSESEVTDVSRDPGAGAAGGAAAPTDGGGAVPCAADTPHLPLRGLLAVPLDAPDGSTVGVLQLSDRYAGDFTEDDEAVLVQLGEVASAAVHKTRLYEERSRVAEALQRPLHPPSLPSIPGVDVAACYEPFGEMLSVGGDFYDVFRVPSGRWVAVLGDVCGKGPEAAALTGLVRQTLWAAAQHSDDPADVLALLNEAVLRSETDRFATAGALVLDTAGPAVTLTYASAGHPPPLVACVDGTVRPVEGEGMLLGMFPDIGVRARTLTLGPGDTLVLYTDGLTEGGGAASFDGADLRHAVAGLAGRPAAAVVEGLLAEVRRRRAHQRDDLALLVLRASGDS